MDNSSDHVKQVEQVQVIVLAGPQNETNIATFQPSYSSLLHDILLGTLSLITRLIRRTVFYSAQTLFPPLIALMVFIFVCYWILQFEPFKTLFEISKSTALLTSQTLTVAS